MWRRARSCAPWSRPWASPATPTRASARRPDAVSYLIVAVVLLAVVLWGSGARRWPGGPAAGGDRALAGAVDPLAAGDRGGEARLQRHERGGGEGDPGRWS